MKPEDGFDKHVQRGGQVVAPPDMRQFMSDDGLNVLVVQPRRKLPQFLRLRSVRRKA